MYTPACMARTSDTNTFAGKKALAYGEITLTFWYNKIISLTQVGAKQPIMRMKMTDLRFCWRWSFPCYPTPSVATTRSVLEE